VASLIDLFDLEEFREMQAAGFVKVQRHPEFPDQLALANYTHKAQQNYHWNAVTEQCRGLIFHPVSLRIVARPFRKFYNYGEKNADLITAQETVRAYEKFDGSLGITYPIPGSNYEEYAVATRGSFTSEQALWATNFLRSKREQYPFIPGYTDLFEIIYPDNRIVVEYGGLEDLVYLGTIENDTGRFSFEDDMFDVRADSVYVGPFEGVFQLQGRQGKEGVVAITSDGRRVKVKEEEYIRLHRIVSNLSEKYVWEAMQGPYMHVARDLAANIPEEHATWLLGVAERLVCEYVIQASQVNELVWNTKNMATRKERAVFVQESGYPKHIQGAYFAQLDGKSSVPVLWKSVKPKDDKEEVQVDD
jgi:putative RNA ligase